MVCNRHGFVWQKVTSVLGAVLLGGLAGWLSYGGESRAADQLVLEAFQAKEADGFPSLWENESQRSDRRAQRQAHDIPPEPGTNWPGSPRDVKASVEAASALVVRKVSPRRKPG